MLGRGEGRVQAALEEIRQVLPFRLRGIDSDNGSEFINDHLYRYCQAQEIQFTRGRPYKKDDNAHIEQKNWTHVRKLVGYWRYDTPTAVAAMNALYQGELRLFHNLFLPSVKLVAKERVGARLRRRYDVPRTPLERVQACPEADPQAVAALRRLRDRLDPFALAEAIDRKIERLVALATPARAADGPAPPRPVSRSSCRPRRNHAPEGRPTSRTSRSPTTYAGPTLARRGLLVRWLDDSPSVSFLDGLTGRGAWALDEGRPPSENVWSRVRRTEATSGSRADARKPGQRIGDLAERHDAWADPGARPRIHEPFREPAIRRLPLPGAPASSLARPRHGPLGPARPPGRPRE